MKQKGIFVEWIDSSSQSGWRTEQSLKNKIDLKCTSFGYLSHEDDEVVCVSSSRTNISEDNSRIDFNGTIRIPKKAIIKRRNVFIS